MNDPERGKNSVFDLTTPSLTIAQSETIRRLFTNDAAPRFALGTNRYAASVAELVDLTGFIDDYTADREFLGRPVIQMKNVPQGASVVSCVVDGRPTTALQRLAEHGLQHVVDYFSLKRAGPSSLASVSFLSDSRDDVLQNMSRYEELYHRLADDHSRAVLQQVVAFRCTGDLSRMAGFQYAVDRQYFEEFVVLRKGEVFVDGGGFDGMTSLDFAGRCPDHGSIYLFEPGAKVLEVARQRLANVAGMHFFQKGLFDRETSLRFDGSAGPASSISEHGADEIQVTTIDRIVDEAVTFIKLDVEGAECAALAGASGHIANDRPKLAVCVYHNQSDFWQVPERVLGIRQDYDVYLRHYTEGVLETVMYFIPTTATSGQRPDGPR